MSAIDQLFQQLRSQGRKALMPFLTAGDPDLETTVAAIDLFQQLGCSMCEVGVPYSDPIADGPVIQASYTRALAKGITVTQILEALEAAQAQRTLPLVTMVSYAVIHRWGPRRFVRQAQQAGVAGAIVPDLLADEADELRAVCREEDFSLIHLVTPTTPRDRALRIAEQSSGFLYYVSVTGITGARDALPAELTENVAWLKQRTPLPICIGFGVSRPEHVRTLAPVADGVIVGSALVRVLERTDMDRAGKLAALADVVRGLVAALDG